MDEGYSPSTARFAEGAEAKEVGIIEDLDRELSRLEELAEAFAVRLGPISNQYDAKISADSAPRQEPSSAMRGRVERLRDICARLDRIHRDIEL